MTPNSTGPEVWAIVLAGGRGARFWPLSRDDRPKQLLCVDGRETLLRTTVRRCLGLVPADRILVVAGAQFAGEVRTSLPMIPAANVIAEPEGRDTLPAAALGTLAAAVRAGCDDIVTLVTPCDHAVGGLAGFRRTIAVAAACAADSEGLVTIGALPVRPETGYGYILPGEALKEGRQARAVAGFIEKPDAARAARLCAAGALWNTGLFVWRPRIFERELERRFGGRAAAASAAMRMTYDASASLSSQGQTEDSLCAAYRCLPRTSVDRALLERGATAHVVRAAFAWDDLGSWGALWRRGTSDGCGNVCTGLAKVVGGRDNLVLSTGLPVVVAGVDDLAVIATEDVLFVTAKALDQEVKAVRQQLADSPLRRCL